MKGNWNVKGVFALIGILLLGSNITVYAEETTPAGYHVYDVQDDQVTDTWYGIARGDHLRSAVCKLAEDSPGNALCSGSTLAHRTSDRVYVRIYLDQSDTGTGGWGTIDYWTGETFNAATASASSGKYKVTRHKYYRVRGGHSVTQDGYTETTMTCTDALLFD